MSSSSCGASAPIPAVPTPAARAAARARLLRAPRRGARARGAPCSASPTAAVAAAAAIAVVSGLDEGQRHARRRPPPREALRRVATVAEHRTGPGIPRDDQYFYVASEGTELTTRADARSRRLLLLPLHQAPRDLAERRPARAPAPAARSARGALADAARPRELDQGRAPRREPAAPAARDAMGPIRHYLLGDERFTSAQLRAYDPTPQELFDRLRAKVGDRGQSPDGEVFVEIADALRESPQTPRLRATLYRALALVPGVQLLGHVHDRLGPPRRSASPSPSTTGLRQELLFDPETAEILNERRWWRPVEGLGGPVGHRDRGRRLHKRAVTDATSGPRRARAGARARTSRPPRRCRPAGSRRRSTRRSGARARRARPRRRPRSDR